jgi:prepilin peptidase CpaA
MELVQGCAVAAASAAACVDVLSHRIPNWITFGAFGLGVVINVWLSGPSGALFALAGALLGVAMLLPLYVIRAMGAGDVKLLAAVGALLGPQLLVSVAVYAAIAGGVMSVVILLRRHRLFIALNEMLVLRRPPTRSGATAPYGIAIASGVYLSLLLPGVLG